MQGTKARQQKAQIISVGTEEDGQIAAADVSQPSNWQRLSKLGPASSDSSGARRTSDLVPQTRAKKRKVAEFFSLEESEDLPEVPVVVELDELSIYLKSKALVDDFQAEYDRDDPFSGPLFWLHRMVKFPELFEVALRIFAVPASSTTSEHTFSQVARTVTPERATMVSRNIENVVVAKSAMMNSIRPKGI